VPRNAITLIEILCALIVSALYWIHVSDVVLQKPLSLKSLTFTSVLLLPTAWIGYFALGWRHTGTARTHTTKWIGVLLLISAAFAFWIIRGDPFTPYVDPERDYERELLVAGYKQEKELQKVRVLIQSCAALVMCLALWSTLWRSLMTQSRPT